MKKLIVKSFFVFIAFIFLIALYILFDGQSFCLAKNFCFESASGLEKESVNNATTSNFEEAKLTTDTVPTINNVQPRIENPTPTNDPDPVVTCNSKTGKIQVKSSVCRSYTDCPDGYGRYVFESQEACKARWSTISAGLKNAADQYGKATLEQMNLMNQASQIQSSPLPTVAIANTLITAPPLNMTIKDIPQPTQPGGGSMHYAGY